MKKINIFLLTLSIALILTASSVPLKDSMAYFTTYAHAEGGYTIELGSSTRIEEPKVEDWTKHVVITNEEGSQPVYVRVRAFSGSLYKLIYSDNSGLWSQGIDKNKKPDGYYYYDEILKAGESTAEILIEIKNVPSNVVDGDSFNVVVIYETTPVLYDEAGKPYPDWSATLDSGSTGSGEGGTD